MSNKEKIVVKLTQDTLVYRGYIGSIEINVDDDCLVGKVLGLNNVLLSYEGTSLIELKQDFQNRIDEYLEDCRQEGIEPQKSYTGVLSIRLTPEVHKVAVVAAKRTGITLNDFIRKSIIDEVESMGLSI